MPIKPLKIILLMVLAVLPVLGQTIRPNHWLEDDVRYYWHRNMLWDLSLLEQPFTAQELVAVFDSLNMTTDEPGLRLLKKMPAKMDAQRALGWLAFDNTFADKSRSTVFHAVQRATIGAQLAPRWQIFTTFYVDNQLDADSTYLGKRQSGVAAFMEQAYILYERGGLRARFGRDYLTWGPGLDASLHLSDVSRPIDHLYLSWKNRWLKLAFFTGGLDKTEFPVDGQPSTQHRYLSGHRIELRPSKFLRLGFAETALFGGPNAGFDFAFINPALFYTGEQHNGPQDANVTASFDIAYMPVKNVLVYGSYLLDDMQFEAAEEDDQEPAEYGLIAGLNWADPFALSGLDFFAEYTRVTNRTYNGQGGPWERYVHRNQPLGHFLGNDFDRAIFGVRYRPTPQWRIVMSYEHRRRGEGRIGDPFTTPWRDMPPGATYSEPFPTGVVETADNFTLTARWQPLLWLYGNIYLSHWQMQNVENQLGINDSYWDVRLILSLELLGTISIR